MNYNGTEYFYVTNLQGDVIELLDSQGNPVISYQYDAWGTILHQTGGDLAVLNPYRYRGYRYDSETQWYYLQSRYYDPSIGRFISSDGLVGEVGNLISHNMYAYGANNPVMNVDPTGEFALSIFIGCVIIGAILGGSIGGYTAVEKGAELGSQEFWLGVGTGALLGGAVGAVAGMSLAGGGMGYLIGGLSSMGNKLLSDITSSYFYGNNNFGTWEDYSIAFISGGIIKGMHLLGKTKWAVDAFARPLLNQIAKMGTRGAEFNKERFAFDVLMRSATHNAGHSTSIFGLDINPYKAFLRGIGSGIGRLTYG